MLNVCSKVLSLYGKWISPLVGTRVGQWKQVVFLVKLHDYYDHVMCCNFHLDLAFPGRTWVVCPLTLQTSL